MTENLERMEQNMKIKLLIVTHVLIKLWLWENWENLHVVAEGSLSRKELIFAFDHWKMSHIASKKTWAAFFLYVQ